MRRKKNTLQAIPGHNAFKTIYMALYIKKVILFMPFLCEICFCTSFMAFEEYLL